MTAGLLRKRAFLMAVFYLAGSLLWLPHPAVAEPTQWSGSIKSLNIYGEKSPAGLFPSYRLSSNRARLNMNWQPGPPDWHFEAALQ